MKSWEKTDANRRVGVGLRPGETRICGWGGGGGGQLRVKRERGGGGGAACRRGGAGRASLLLASGALTWPDRSPPPRASSLQRSARAVEGQTWGAGSAPSQLATPGLLCGCCF